MSPLLSIIASGVLAALLGAAVGGLGTFLATVRGQRMAQHAEARRWKRDRRESAYKAPLAARSRVADGFVEKGDAMQQAGRECAAPSFDFEHWGRVLEPRLTSLYEAIAEIDIYGSTAARDRVRAWDGLNSFMMSTRPGGVLGAGIRSAVRHDDESFRDPFVELIRTELGITD